METLKFIISGSESEDQKFGGLQMNFLKESSEDERVASLLLSHLVTDNLIIAIDFEDVNRFLAQKTNKLFVYEFSVPFDPQKLKEKIKGMDSIIYGVYGSYDLLDMKLFNSIQSVILGNTNNSVGAPIIKEKTTIPVVDKFDGIRIVGLYN